MIISHQSDGSVSVKTKTETISIGNTVSIGNRVIETAGEYDIAAIQCEAEYLDKATVYFFRTEELTLAFLSALDDSITKVDDASNTDILVVDIRSDDTAEKLKQILKSIEPSYLFLVGGGATKEFGDSLGLPAHEGNTLKITRSGLPLEGTFLVPAN